MPNIATLRELQSRNQTTNPPNRAEPVIYLEEEDSENIPGRGAVDHGVKVDTKFNEELTTEMNEDDYVHFEESPKGPDPVPVYIVADATSQGTVVHDWRTLWAAVNATSPTRIAGQHANRTKITIRNSGDVPIYISHELSTANSMSGFPLAAGASIDISTSRAVYGIADSTATGPVSVNLLETFDQVIP
jgi:hypothetical protein